MARLSTGSNTSPTSSTAAVDAVPHVIVKLWSGKSEQQKRRLAQAITQRRAHEAASPCARALIGSCSSIDSA
jgi:hypothetical protein